MAEFKNIALELCLSVLLLGVLRGLFPISRYEKIIRFLLCGVFIMLLLGSIKNLNMRLVFDATPFSFENKATDQRSVLEQMSITHLNQQLSEMGYLSQCTKVELEKAGESWRVTAVFVNARADEEDSVVSLIAKQTKLGKDRIYVSYGKME